MQRFLIAVLLTISFLGCAGHLVGIPFSKQQFINYKLGEPQQASIGDAIIDVESATVRDAYEVLFDYQTPSLGLFGANQIFLKKGDRFTAVASIPSDPEAVCIRKEGPEMQSVLIHIYPDGRVNQGWVLTNGQVPIQGSWPKEQLFAKSKIPSKGEYSFRAQIIYSGLIGNTVKAVYREFSNDYARPAFTQELQYNLDESKFISYKSIKIEILKATNSLIEYRVVEDAGLPWLPK